MIKYNTKDNSGTWGVSYNEKGILLHLDSFRDSDRIILSNEEADNLIQELFDKKNLRSSEYPILAPLQAIKIAGEKMKKEVLNGSKKITIRAGHRDYKKGKVLIGCQILNWVVEKEIVSVHHCSLCTVLISDIKSDGFIDHADALSSLMRYYPDLDMLSPVTVVKWV